MGNLLAQLRDSIDLDGKQELQDLALAFRERTVFLLDGCTLRHNSQFASRAQASFLDTGAQERSLSHGYASAAVRPIRAKWKQRTAVGAASAGSVTGGVGVILGHFVVPKDPSWAQVIVVVGPCTLGFAGLLWIASHTRRHGYDVTLPYSMETCAPRSKYRYCPAVKE